MSIRSTAALLALALWLAVSPSAAFASSPALQKYTLGVGPATSPIRRPDAPTAARTAGARGQRVGRHAALPVGDLAVSASAAVTALALRGGEMGVGSAASLLPPIVTLAVALIFKQVTVALFLGIFSGALLLNDFNPALAFVRCFDTHIVDAVCDREHTIVILFNLILGGTIGLVQKGGGALGLAQAIKKFAKDAKSLLTCSVGLGALIFFDDYASILIVGNSFQPLLGVLKVCQLKFAALTHIVAVAVSASMPVSSWIGLQVGSASTATSAIRASGAVLPDPFVLTMATLPYRLFPLAMLAFVVALLATDKDFGPMQKAVAASNAAAPAAASTSGGDGGVSMGGLAPDPGTPLRAANALLPFAAIVAATLAGMTLDGHAALIAKGATSAPGLVASLSAGNSVLGLLWGSTTGMLTAMALLLGQKILTLSAVMETFVAGMKDVLEPVIVLALAWSLGGIIGLTGTADFIAKGLLAGGLPLWALPSITSVLAYAISFATGSSFGTMGILFPLIGPLAWTLGGGSLPVLLHCFGAVYGGSLFGNMFSPIADTSILTCLATKTKLQDHVATSAPYCGLVALLCLVLGHLPIGLGLYGPFVALAAVVAAQTGVLVLFGKTPASTPPSAKA